MSNRISRHSSKIKRVDDGSVLDGKPVYRVTGPRLGFRDVALGLIRFHAWPTPNMTSRASQAPHWALHHSTGRIDRFETLAEARAEAFKTYG
jgi:hypothetical protein